jgi:hypothetical protein
VPPTLAANARWSIAGAAMAEPVTCSLLGSLPHEACPQGRQSRRWKQRGDYRRRLFLQAAPPSTN